MPACIQLCHRLLSFSWGVDFVVVFHYAVVKEECCTLAQEENSMHASNMYAPGLPQALFNLVNVLRNQDAIARIR